MDMIENHTQPALALANDRTRVGTMQRFSGAGASSRLASLEHALPTADAEAALAADAVLPTAVPLTVPVSYEAQAVLGVELDPAKLYRERVLEHRGCTHTLPDGANFCPECGAPARITETIIEPLPEFRCEDPWHMELCGFPVFSCPDPSAPEMRRVRGVGTLRRVMLLRGETNPGRWRLFVGALTARTDQTRLARMATVDGQLVNARHLLREALTPLGLWDESKFGLWAIQNRL